MTSASTSQNHAVQNGSGTGANDPQTPPSARETDPNVLQRRASEPDTSVWVTASAGTGKTKVLTDRVLRLLLPREDGRPGTPAHKILCLTFTKAAASEMALRLSETLSQWAVLPEGAPEDKNSLRGKLKALLGRPATHEELKAARKLFAEVIDVPGGLKIMTIHAFCQSVLGRFPLEAKISPHFTVLEDAQAQTFMERARAAALTRAEVGSSDPLGKALAATAGAVNEEQFQSLLSVIARERAQLSALFTDNRDEQTLHAALCAQLDIPPNLSTDALIAEFCANTGDLHAAARIMAEIGTKTDKENADKILPFLAATPEERPNLLDTYTSAFVTQKHQPRAKFAGKAVCEADPGIPEILSREADRLLILREQINAANTAALTLNLLTLGRAVLDEYESLKTAAAALDFDDLILRTLELLTRENMAGWIHYKLDQGLDHVLIDEAQDTNPEQWKIAQALCSEFFYNAQNSETDRTVFVVGDEKQSIYSFQRASPEEFEAMKHDFEHRVRDAGQKWDPVPMNTSFRSVKSVLNTVDAVFADPAARKGLGLAEIEHTAYRRGQAGRVELWPLCESDEGKTPDLWTPLIEPEDQQSGQKKLATHIAKTIKNWLANGEKLESYDRAIQPGDIMILVRTRSKLVSQISRELKNAEIPLSGLDRMVLSEELAVQDMFAAAEFTLQPRDDLTLACLLKSPLIGLDEDKLYSLAIDRAPQTLLERVQQQAPEIATYLHDLCKIAVRTGPFMLFSHILRTPCPGDEISGRRAFMARLGPDSMDPLDELLSAARQYEQTQTASLQHFINRQRAQNTEIKRQQHGEANEVRIMTVHGSKGLQAPVVILPDTIATPAQAPGRAEKRLLWPSQTGLDVPLWSPRKDEDPAGYTTAMTALDEKLDEEYRRLLYVAMTRAEDRLYIGGALNKKQSPDKRPEGCWYTLIENGLQRLETQAGEDGGLCLTNPQREAPDKASKNIEKQTKTLLLPDWLRTPAPEETQDNRVYRPSRALETAISPLKDPQTHRFLRGNLTHKLLQLLPEIPPDRWQTVSERFLERYSNDFDTQRRTEIIEETLRVLHDERFAAIFGLGSRAEVPITGFISGKGKISGQIDRLCVTEDEILIIDYKTNRPPPADQDGIPDIYREQLKTYAQILHGIYPGKTVRAALLWTDGPNLMPLDLEVV